MELIDTHCHLFQEPLASRLEEVLTRARANAIHQMIVPAFDLESWASIEALVRNQGIFAAYGIHPWAIEKHSFSRESLAQHLRSSRAVAVGEVGLDFALPNPNRPRQIAGLIEQLELAVKIDLPVILHCRRAFGDLLALLRNFPPTLRVILHGFSRGPRLAEQLLRFNMAIAFNGLVTRPTAKAARNTVKELPIEHLLLESDAPSAGGVGVTKGQSEPCHLLNVAETVAEIKNITVEEVAYHTTKNAKRLFRLCDS